MPRHAIDYSNTYFYKIVCKDPTITDCYVGHTTDFIKRRSQHKTLCNNPSNKNNKKYNFYVYEFIRENGGWDNWQMIVIECITCKDAHDATFKEREWLEKLQATLNKYIPSRTKLEYYEQNKDKILEHQKQYYGQNKDKIVEHQKQYNDLHKEQIAEYKKKYYEQNKDRIAEYKKKYYDLNKDKIVEHQKQYNDLHKNK